MPNIIFSPELAIITLLKHYWGILKKRIEIIVKWLVPIFVIVFIYLQIKTEIKSISNVIENIDWSATSILILILLLFLMICNWLTESLKWKFLINRIAIVTNRNAFSAILNGLAFGLFTPFKVGDVIARIAHIDSKDKNKALGSVLIARSSQMVTTILFGCFGLLYFPYISINAFLLLLIMVVTVTVYYRLEIIVPIIKRIGVLTNYIKYVEVLNDYGVKDFSISLSMSILRYAIILTQYLLMFKFFNIELGIADILISVSIVMFVKSILPLMSVLGDFGIRELVAIYVLNFYGINSIEVLLVTISIWLINVILPSLIGSFLTKNFKLS